MLTMFFNRLFERGANAVGLDFLSHPFWDKYIEFEERLECEDKIFAILERVVHIPMHQYSRYFERFRALAQTRPLTELLPEDTLAQFRSEVIASDPPLTSEAEIEREVRTRIDQFHLEIFARTQTETTKRWTYESEIKRPYFHVTELDEPQLVNWRKYLDFEEAEKSGFDRVQFLYERCLVTCALYDEFWYRYARWMYAQPGHEEEVRNIYQRASMVFVPISRLGIRLQYAVFEESTGRPDMARAIYESVIECLPGNIETIIAWANFERRQGGLEAAIAVYRAQIENDRCDIYAKGALTAEWARLLWKVKGNVGEAREVFEKNSHWYLDSRYFWINYLQFELDQPTSAATEKQQYERISKVVDDIRKKSHLPPLTVKDLTHQYMVYLLERGIPFPPTPAASPSAAAAPGTAPSTKPDPTSVAKEYLHLDKEVNGPFSVRRDEKIKLAEDGKETTTERRMMRENGHPGVEVDDQSLARGESPYVKLFQMQGDSVGAAGAQGSVAAQ